MDSSILTGVTVETTYLPYSTLQKGQNIYGATRTKDVSDIAEMLSLETIGGLAPLDVDANYQVLAGDRRFEAIGKWIKLTDQDADLIQVSVKIHRSQDASTYALSPEQRAFIAINENERRKDATTCQTIEAFYHLVVAVGMKNKDAAAMFLDAKGKPRNAAWGSLAFRVGETFAASPVFAAECHKQDLSIRTMYDIISAFGMNEKNQIDAGLLSNLAKRLKAQDPQLLKNIARSNAVADEKSKKNKDDKKGKNEGEGDNRGEGEGEDSKEPAPTKLISTKSLLKVLDEAGDLITGKAKENADDPLLTQAKKNFSAFERMIVSLLKGKLDAAKLANKLTPTE